MQKILSLLLLSTLFILTGCGGDSFKVVSNLNYDTRDNDNYETLAHVDFELTIGEAELPTVTYDLPNGLGHLSLVYGEGKNVASLDINLTEALKLPAGDATLPNGSKVPLYSSNGIIQVDIEAINASVYLAHNGVHTVIGFAMAIEQLDGVGSELGNVGLFPSFNIKAVRVTAGLFSSSEGGNTGVAAFADFKELIPAQTRNGKLYLYGYKYGRKYLRRVQHILNKVKDNTQKFTPVRR